MSGQVKINTKVTGLNIRKGAGTSYPVVGVAPIGTVYNFTDTKYVSNQPWYNIPLGWISGGINTVYGEPYSIVISTDKVVSTNPVNTNDGADEDSVVASSGIDTNIGQRLYDATNKINDRENIQANTRLFGIPHQFTGSTDFRANSSFDIGRKFMETIVAEAPIMTVLPGAPSYLPDLSSTEKEQLDGFFKSFALDNPIDTSQLSDILSKNKEVRYFGFTAKYYEYMRFVNLLCSVTAVMIGLKDDQGLDLDGKFVPYKKMNWANYKFGNKAYASERTGEGAFDTENKAPENDRSRFEEIIAEMTGESPNYVQYYVESNASFNESMGNNTQQSKVEGLFDQAEGIVKELAFLADTGASKDGFVKAQDITGDFTRNLADKAGDSPNFMNRILGMSSNVIQGSNLLFPELWSDAQYSKSYSISLNFVSPYGTKEAVYLNVLVPLMHIIALSLPRQTSANSYAAPFLIKAFAKGFFNCEMGIVDSITIEKGGSGDSWTVDGLPTEVRVSLSIKDLYTKLSMTKESQVNLFFQNQSLIEFLGALCGVNLIKSEFQLKVDLIKTLLFGYVENLPRRAFEDIADTLRNNVFGLWRSITTFSKY